MHVKYVLQVEKTAGAPAIRIQRACRHTGYSSSRHAGLPDQCNVEDGAREFSKWKGGCRGTDDYEATLETVPRLLWWYQLTKLGAGRRIYDHAQPHFEFDSRLRAAAAVESRLARNWIDCRQKDLAVRHCRSHVERARLAVFVAGKPPSAIEETIDVFRLLRWHPMLVKLDSPETVDVSYKAFCLVVHIAAYGLAGLIVCGKNAVESFSSLGCRGTLVETKIETLLIASHSVKCTGCGTISDNIEFAGRLAAESYVTAILEPAYDPAFAVVKPPFLDSGLHVSPTICISPDKSAVSIATLSRQGGV